MGGPTLLDVQDQLGEQSECKVTPGSGRGAQSKYAEHICRAIIQSLVDNTYM